jgi:hypothetical protein
MKLVSVTLNDIRRFSHPVVVAGIGPGLNVLSAPNETGKSTFFDALQAMFFVPHRSSGRDIKALKPHAGGAPEVTVEIDTAAGRFVLTKRWMSRPSAEVWQGDRLIAKADEAEAWISALTQSGADGGPAGLLWVRQGLTALDQGSTKEQDAAKSARRDLMSSVTGEVEALTGGRRMDRALARARDDLAPLVTATGRAKAGGPLALAEQEVSVLTARKAELTALARLLTEALERRRIVRRSLSQLQEPAAAEDRAKRLADAKTAADQARRHAEALDKAKSDLSTAEWKQAEAAQALTRFRKARDDLAKARVARTETATTAETTRAALAASEKVASERQSALHTARKAQTLAETTLRAALRAEAARGAQAQRADLSARLSALRGLSADLAVLRKAATVGPDARTLAALDAIAQEVAVLTTLRNRSATRMAMTYRAGVPPLTLGETDLPDGVMVPVLADTAIDLPGMGKLTIYPGEGGDTSVRLADAERSLAAALAKAGYDTIADARAAATARAEATSRLRDIESRISALAPKGIEALEADLAGLPDPLAIDATVPDVATAQALADESTHALTLAEAAFDAARHAADQDRQADARASVAAQTAVAAVASAEIMLASLGDSVTAETSLMAAQDAATTDLSAARARFEGLVATAPNLAAVEAALARAQSVCDGAAAEIRDLALECAGLDARIDLHSGNGVEEELADVTARLTLAQARLDSLTFEVAVLNTLIRHLDAARETARERYFQPVMAELQPLLRVLWPEAELRFDGESLLPTTLIRNGQEEDIGILSGGTQEQIALLVRLAFARLLARSGHAAPVILDDALVFTDDDRIERMFDALHAQAQDLQIIVLSCRQRAFRDLGGRKLAFAPIEHQTA